MTKARKMLSNLDAPYISPLVELIETQSKSTLVHWAVDYAQQVILPVWSAHFPDDLRPEHALHAARGWLSGAVPFALAKKSILDCHAAAREADAVPAAQAAARAIGQSASTIHSAKHCLGLPLYGALAVVYDRLGTSVSREEIEQYAADECGRMLAALRGRAAEHESDPANITWKY